MLDWELGFTVIVITLTEKVVISLTDDVITLANDDVALLMSIDDINDDDNSTLLTDDGVTSWTCTEKEMKEF